MNADGWLADTRISYDTVAASYADQLRDALARYLHLRGALALFTDLVHAAGDFTQGRRRGGSSTPSTPNPAWFATPSRPARTGGNSASISACTRRLTATGTVSSLVEGSVLRARD
jgi:hypothetical protein